MRDFRKLQNDPPSGVSGAPMDNNIMLWQAVIFGCVRLSLSMCVCAKVNRTPLTRVCDRVAWNNSPDDTPWEGGTFNLTLEFSEDYPNKAPTVRFITKMFHPNSTLLRVGKQSGSIAMTADAVTRMSAVYNDGQICLDILQNQWSPIYDISAILTSIQSLLCDPNPNSPANSEAARLFQENRREYNRRVREIVEQSWVAIS